MLRKNHLYELIKSLDVHEKRYLLGKGAKPDGLNTAYVKIINLMYSMDEYSEAALKSAFKEFSKSEKTDVKKHYLYYWVLKHLYDYHASKFSNHRELRNIAVLVDRSLIHHADALLPAIKSRIIESEKYIDLLMLLELEIQVQRYQHNGNPLRTIKELIHYSKRYTDLQSIELIRYKFRQLLDINVFTRNNADSKKIRALFRDRIIKSRPSDEGFLLNFNYNMLHYWRHGTDGNWERAFKFAHDNFELLKKHPKIIIHFPDAALQIAQSFTSSASIIKSPLYIKGLSYLKKLATQKQSKRLKDNLMFQIHLAELIHYNRNRPASKDYRFIREADLFIEENKDSFSGARINNYYFDLAKSYFYIGEYKKAFRLLNEIYQHHYTRDQTIDFHTHSRLLLCLTCYETGDWDLMVSIAKALVEFMKRNAVYYKFEQRIIRFITKELSTVAEKSKIVQEAYFKKLKTDLQLIFKSIYERKVINYFDYIFWIDNKLEQIKSQTLHQESNVERKAR
ncbi:MAG: hypothetical protein RIQ47_1949 [Bacteroidota bacterium]|jgi:hypothetical protein